MITTASPPSPLPSSARRKPGTQGVFLGLSAVEYFDDPALNHSTKKRIRPTPAHLKAYVDELAYEPPSAGMILGTLVHHAILTGDLAWPQLALKPSSIDFRSSLGKEWRAAQEAAGKIIVTPAEFDALCNGVQNALTHPLLSTVLQAGDPEVSCFTVDPEHEDLPVKCRIDFVPSSGNALLDLKTTARQATAEDFAKTIADYEYHCQAAWYLDIWNRLHPDDPRTEWVFAVFETSGPPHAIAVYSLSQDAIHIGRERNRADLDVYLGCLKTGCWPGYQCSPIPVIDLPRWAKPRIIA